MHSIFIGQCNSQCKWRSFNWPIKVSKMDNKFRFTLNSSFVEKLHLVRCQQRIMELSAFLTIMSCLHKMIKELEIYCFINLYNFIRTHFLFRVCTKRCMCLDIRFLFLKCPPLKADSSSYIAAIDVKL